MLRGLALLAVVCLAAAADPAEKGTFSIGPHCCCEHWCLLCCLVGLPGPCGFSWASAVVGGRLAVVGLAPHMQRASDILQWTIGCVAVSLAMVAFFEGIGPVAATVPEQRHPWQPCAGPLQHAFSSSWAPCRPALPSDAPPPSRAHTSHHVPLRFQPYQMLRRTSCRWGRMVCP